MEMPERDAGWLLESIDPLAQLSNSRVKTLTCGCSLEEPHAPAKGGGCSLKNLTTSTPSSLRKHLPLRPVQTRKQTDAHTVCMECTAPGIARQRRRPRVVGTVPVPVALSHRAMEEAEFQCFLLCVCTWAALSGPTVTSQGGGSCDLAAACLDGLSSRHYGCLPQ